LSDIQNGTLPAVSYVIPPACASDHPHQAKNHPLAGPYWVAAITNAIGTSNYWNRTLILVTWDDWGGWYDHVPPPVLDADQLGFRVPLMIISAYPVAAGVVDHRLRNQASIITVIEAIFGLRSLGQLDAKSDDLHADFRFDRSPQPYGAPLPSGIISARQKCGIVGGEE
jgi:phospholipase C